MRGTPDLHIPLFLGIDPGENGGFGLLDGSCKILSAIKRPATLKEIALQLTAYKELGPVTIYAHMEEVASRPGQSMPAMFKFGRGFGALEMALTCLMIDYKLVKPQVWQYHMKCMTKGDKRVSKARAQALWPDFKFTHATADAVLIAEFARRLYFRMFGKGELP